jgi:hypothetical protein
MGGSAPGRRCGVSEIPSFLEGLKSKGGKNQNKKFSWTAADGIVECRDTTNNQKWADAEEKRTEEREECGEVAEGSKFVTSACRGREMVMYHIINDCTLQGHYAECHDPNTVTTASKLVGKPDRVYFNNIIVLHVKIRQNVSNTGI